MFVDIVDYTGLATNLDPEELRAVVSAFHAAVASEITTMDGHIAQYLGDGVLAYFGYPRAHEDEAARCVRAGLGILLAVRGLSISAKTMLQVRIGIATGLVVVGDSIAEGSGSRLSVVGDTPNMAARLQALAAPSDLLVAKSTRDLLGASFALDSLGPMQLKGFPVAIDVFRVTYERIHDSRFLANHRDRIMPLLGRDHELALLQARWSMACGGEGQLVLLTGDAGIGKSRLVEALVTGLSPPNRLILRYQCSPLHSESPLYPVIQHLRIAAARGAGESHPAGIEQSDPASILDFVKVAMSAGRNPEPSDQFTPASAELNPLAPAQRRTRLLTLLTSSITELAARNPVLMIVEDAHWIDATTKELLEQVTSAIVSLPVLVVVTARPGFDAPIERQSIVTQLHLNRLGRAALGALVQHIAEDSDLPATVRAKIVARSDGVPLFLEEIAKATLEARRSNASLDDERRGSEDLEWLVPTNLHDSLLARLDRLDSAREVAGMAAVIGRDFSVLSLSHLSDLPASELERVLTRLVSVDILIPRGPSPTAHYQFKHALLRDAAYAALLRSTRTTLHRRLVNVLAEQGDAPPEELARHAELGGDISSAITFWDSASVRALAQPAYEEAIAHLNNALRLCEGEVHQADVQERVQRYYVQKGQALIATQGYSAKETLAAFQRAMDIAVSAGNATLSMPASYGRLAALYVGGLSTSQAARDFSLLTARHASPEVQQVASRHLALAYLHEGRIKEAAELLERVVTDYEAEAHKAITHKFGQDNRIAASAYLGIVRWLLGTPADAIVAVQHAYDWARELAHPPSLAYALNMGVCLTNVCLRRTDIVRDAAAEQRALADRMSLRLWRGWADIDGGWANSFEDLATGVATMERGLADKHATGAKRHDPLNFCMLADVYLRAGRAHEANAALDQAAAAAQSGADLIFKSEILRMRAIVAIASGTSDPIYVEQILKAALAAAMKLEANGLSLRAARDLAAFYSTRGERERAQDVLIPVLTMFVESDDTLDILDARELLDSL